MRDTILFIIARGWSSSKEELTRFPDLLRKFINVKNLPLDIRVQIVTKDPDIKLLKTDKAVVIGGSPNCLDENLPWMRALKKFIKEVKSTDIKLLGICFGHQIIAEALGGKVGKCPKGGELGEVIVELTEEGKKDSVFNDISNNFTALSAHRDVVVQPPSGSVILAKNKSNEYQALSIGPNIRTIQFHPEMTTKYLRKIISTKKSLFEKLELIKSQKGYEDLLKSLSGKNSSYMSMRILMNFLREL